MFLAGVSLTIGMTNTFHFFFKIEKVKVYAPWCIHALKPTRLVLFWAQGSALFFLGILIVLFGWPVFGMIIECVGFYFLFRFVFHD